MSSDLPNHRFDGAREVPSITTASSASDVKIPDWAIDMARKVRAEMGFVNDRLGHAEIFALGLIEAEARGAERMKEQAAEVIGGYPPDGFNAALYERTERYDEHDPFWKFDGDTGNWAALMGEVLKPYAEAIRNLEPTND
jgi:hypothetical protein